MTRLLLSCVLLAATAGRGDSRQAAADPPRPPVVIDAVAFDRSGRAVMDLKPAEVEVWIGHFRVPIDTFTVVSPGADEREARLFVLLLDDISVPLPIMSRVKEVARRFVAAMGPRDQLAVVSLSDPVLESTNDPARLRRAIDSYSVRATGLARADQLGAHVLSTVDTIARSLAEAGEGRKTIVGIGSAWLLDRPIPPPSVGYDLRTEWIAAMRSMSRTSSTFYVIDPGGVGTARVDGGESGFARETGGMAFVNTNDLDGAADRIMRESASHYALRVKSPPVGGSSGLRELDVRVERRGVTIRARRAIH
jgi:VWFA-related protein